MKWAPSQQPNSAVQFCAPKTYSRAQMADQIACGKRSSTYSSGRPAHCKAAMPPCDRKDEQIANRRLTSTEQTSSHTSGQRQWALGFKTVRLTTRVEHQSTVAGRDFVDEDLGRITRPKTTQYLPLTESTLRSHAAWSSSPRPFPGLFFGIERAISYLASDATNCRTVSPACGFVPSHR